MERWLPFLIMLQNLNIIDLAIVESLDLNLEKGLSVLTGETGAGIDIRFGFTILANGAAY
jgi:hypothetical protein